MEAQLRILEEEDIERIHSRSLRLLSEVGVQVDNEQMCRFLRREGLAVSLAEMRNMAVTS